MELKMENDISIKDAMTYNVITATSDTTISDIATIMTENDISSVVIEDQTVKGIVTSNDIISKVVSKNIAPQNITAGMVMREFISIAPNTSLNEASSLMIKNNTKLLLVMDDDNLKGILTQTDIVGVSPELIGIFIEQRQIDDSNYQTEDNYSDGYKESLDEGVCEKCGVYDQLKNIDGQYLCSNCMDESEED